MQNNHKEHLRQNVYARTVIVVEDSSRRWNYFKMTLNDRLAIK